MLSSAVRDTMLRPALLLLLLQGTVLSAASSSLEHAQVPLMPIVGPTTGLQAPQNADGPVRTSPKQLHGRFLHITDIHPDPHYVNHGTISTSCHRKKPKKDTLRGNYWGAARREDCDSPYALVNLTMAWLEKEWADKVDFVIWTGDSARHDNDHELPRTPKEIFDLNRRTVASIEKIFTSRGVPVVPSLGNNDLFPHNIMYPGPNEITKAYEDIWKSFIPFPSYQIFQRGAYFSVEVIPNKLAAISLNTLYWYDSNKAVDGCQKGSSDPGTLELNWLEVQLNQYRDRKMQVWLSGHVPPSMGNYYQDCYLGYARLALRFQDTIVGHLFGHMNVDHFFWIDPHELHHPPPSRIWSRPKKQRKDSAGAKGVPMSIKGRKPRYSLSQTLLEDFQSLPPEKKPEVGKGHKINYDDYVVVNVGPSVLPAYLPSVRVFGYNTTGWDEGDDDDEDDGQPDDEMWDYDDNEDDEDEDGIETHGNKRHHGHRHGPLPPGHIDCTRRKNRDKDQCVFGKPRHASKDSPSRSNKLWTPLGYTQFFLPNMETSNRTHPPDFEVEYMTYKLEALSPPTDWPIPQHLLPPTLQNLTSLPLNDDGSQMRSEFTPYGLKDLTIPSYIRLARKIGQKKGLFKKFKKFMYLGGEED